MKKGKKNSLWIITGIFGGIFGITSAYWTYLLNNLICSTYEAGIPPHIKIFHYACISDLFGYGISDVFFLPFFWMIVFGLLGLTVGYLYQKFLKRWFK